MLLPIRRRRCLLLWLKNLYLLFMPIDSKQMLIKKTQTKIEPKVLEAKFPSFN
jgi:hypothetical protein